MSKFYFASFNRASDGAIASLKALVRENGMLADNYSYNIDYLIAVGDRKETFDFVLDKYRDNMKIIHLWAGEHDNFATHDDVYRASISLMSDVQLCANYDAKYRIDQLFRAVDKKPNSYIVGTPYLDDITVDDSLVPDGPYDLILYNPVTTNERETRRDFNEIIKLSPDNHIWIEPNGDLFTSNLGVLYTKHYQNIKTCSCGESEVTYTYPRYPGIQYGKYARWIGHGKKSDHPFAKNMERSKYLGLLRSCQRFITNSSSEYIEAAFFHKKVVHIGARNQERDSKYAEALMPGCKERVLEVLKSLA